MCLSERSKRDILTFTTLLKGCNIEAKVSVKYPNAGCWFGQCLTKEIYLVEVAVFGLIDYL